MLDDYRTAYVHRLNNCWLVYRPVSRYGRESKGRQFLTIEEVDEAVAAIKQEAKDGGWSVSVSYDTVP